MKTGKLILAFAMFISMSAGLCYAADQKTFATPEEAVKALMSAVEANNQDELLAIFGPDGKDLVSSGDAVQDKNALESFVKSYKAKHVILKEGEKTRVLQVGTKGWELPIPIVLADGKWHFDTAAGEEELVYRRIGENELGAIAVCRGVIASQIDYAAVGHDGLPAGIYAEKLRSDPGKHNGLYWKVAEGETPSPAGPFLAAAAEEGYQKGDPYHGYYFHGLKAQGAAAKGGAKSYIVDGELTGGTGVIAYPAQYKASGVMTFIVNQDGVVYQKDLGPNTSELAKAISEYNPDSTWTKVKD
ncbi:MAG: DUF2950 domain-containing protein [Candidatus Acidiferrum sp.]